MNLFSLYAKIGLDASEYDKGIKEAQSKGKSFAKSMAFDLSGMAQKIKTGLKVTATAGVGFIAALGKIGLDYNAQMETYTTNFEVMLGDAEAAQKKVNEISDMAAKTPFELTDLASATQTLLAFNVASDDTNTVLQQLGDISLGNTQKLDSLTRAYGKMNASQKVTLEDINMMIDSGYNPLLNIQQKTGESMEELYARISDGEVEFSEIQQAIADATSEGGQFAGGMEKASQTTEGLVSTLQDVVKSKAGEFFSGVSSKIKEALPNVISFIENIDVSEVTQTIKGLYDRFVELSPVIAGVTSAVVAFRTAMTIAVIVESATKAITAFKIANDAATLSQALLNAAMNANPFVLIVTLIAGVVTALVTLWNTNDGFRNAVIEIWTAIQDKFQQAWEFIKSIWSNVAPYFSEIWDRIKIVLNSAIEAFKAGFQLVQQIAGIVADFILNAFTIAWDGIKEVWNFVGPFFSALWSGIKTVFSVVPDVLGSFFRLAWKYIQNVWNVATSYFKTIFNSITGIFSAISAVLRGDFQAAWDAIVDVFSGWKDFFQGLFNSVIDIFGNIWETFKGIGEDIVGGIKEGISNAWDGLVNWFNDLWDSLFDRDVEVDVDYGSSRSYDGSHRMGLNYVPFDGYIAELHKGERVLTAEEAKDYNNSRSGEVTVIQYIYSEAKTAADLMREARQQQERAVLLGV